jgi:hypothetical protein
VSFAAGGALFSCVNDLGLHGPVCSVADDADERGRDRGFFENHDSRFIRGLSALIGAHLRLSD